MNLTCIDAFSGAGGLSLGLLGAGYDILLAFDNDPHCVATQRLNTNYFSHPTVLASIDDMLKGRALALSKLKKGELFLLAGGPPCQGFSVQRIGDDKDVRNDLVGKFILLVEELLPYYFLMENVPGIEGKRGRAILKTALSKIWDRYELHHKTLDAQDYGVPQRRKRVVIVGERRNDGSSFFDFPAPVTPEGRRITVRSAIGHLPPPSEDGTDHPKYRHHRRDRLSKVNRQRLMALQPGQGREYLPEDLLADCHRVSASVIGHRNVYGRMAWDAVAPTITAKFDSFTRGLFGHPEQIRSITLREGALLQNFPEDFVFDGNKVDIARQIGNAVPPALAEALGRQIVLCDAKKSRRTDL